MRDSTPYPSGFRIFVFSCFRDSHGRFRLLPIVLALALLIRAGALLLMPGALRDDPDDYRRLAEDLIVHGTLAAGRPSPLSLGTIRPSPLPSGTIRPSPLPSGTIRPSPLPSGTISPSPLPLGEGQGEGVPTAYRPPLYPLLLAGCVPLGEHGRVAIGLLHVVLGVATVGLVWVLARWWGLGELGAALAALLIAGDPILLAQSAQVMTETLATFLATAGLVLLAWASRRPTKYRAMLAGATLALGVLCRPTLLLWTIAVGVVLFLSQGPR